MNIKRISRLKDLKNNALIEEIDGQLIDPLANQLIRELQWWKLKKLSPEDVEPYPIAITGKGPPIIMLHGFDSCFLEYRRLAPLLKDKNQLFIPDLYGFGFCPRPTDGDYGINSIINKLSEVVDRLPNYPRIGIIGASMGGAIAIELARKYPNKINRLLLLSPAGLTGREMKLSTLLSKIGVCFLRQSFVRESLCKRSFFDPISNVGKAEKEIASIHLKVKGWDQSLAKFAQAGGISNLGIPLPTQPIQVILGKGDRILEEAQKKDCRDLFNSSVQELEGCGHLPHLEKAKYVSDVWLNKNLS